MHYHKMGEIFISSRKRTKQLNKHSLEKIVVTFTFISHARNTTDPFTLCFFFKTFSRFCYDDSTLFKKAVYRKTGI